MQRRAWRRGASIAAGSKKAGRLSDLMLQACIERTDAKGENKREPSSRVDERACVLSPHRFTSRKRLTSRRRGSSYGEPTSSHIARKVPVNIAGITRFSC
jgi:hypothetical protein